MLYGLALSSVMTYSVNAFIPTRLFSGLGYFGVPHSAMTEYGLNSIIQNDFLKDPSDLIMSMDNAREEIKDGSANVDDGKTVPADVGFSEENLAPAHFDGESFQMGHERIQKLRQMMEDSLKSGKAADARQYLGRCLHSIQDFYSHSNWVELDLATPSQTLGRLDVVSPFSNVAGPTEVTCGACGYQTLSYDFNLARTNACKLGGYPSSYSCELAALIAPPICDTNLDPTMMTVGHLTSGYYGYAEQSVTDPFHKPAIKCSHGGPRDTTATGIEGIAKDTDSPYISAHSKLHPAAVTVAKQATLEFLQDVTTQLCGTTAALDCPLLRLLYGYGPSLAFAIDTTGSMGSIISQVITQATTIVNDHRGTIDEPSLFVLAPFNDPTTENTTTTGDADAFIAAISVLGAFGGGDCPELAMGGLMSAVQGSAEGGNVFLWTDAGAKDVSLAGSVTQAALDKGVHVYNFLFPSSCSSGDGFEDVSRATGGLTFYANNALEAAVLVTLADIRIKANAITLALYEKTTRLASYLPGRRFRRQADVATYDIPVDSGMTDLQLALSGAGANLTLLRPDGSDATTDTSNSTRVIPLSAGMLIDIVNPVAGVWKASVVSAGNFSLQIAGAGGMHLTNCRFVESRGSAHEGYFPISADPVPGSTAILMCTLNGNYKTAHFEFHGSGGDLISGIDIPAAFDDDGVSPSNTFIGNVTVPDVTYLIYVTGELNSGESYTRVLPRVFVIPPSNSTNSTTRSSTTTSSTSSPISYYSSYPSSAPSSHGGHPSAAPSSSPTKAPVTTHCKECGEHPETRTCPDNYPTTTCAPPPKLTTTTRYVCIVNIANNLGYYITQTLPTY